MSATRHMTAQRRLLDDQGRAMDDMSRIPSGHCKKVFLARDFSEGTGIKFSTKFPTELDGKIEQKDFKYTVDQINAMFAEAEALSGRTYCESCVACLTAYLSYLCFDTYYEKMLKKIHRFVQEQNETMYGPRGLVLIDPADRGLRCLEICIMNNDR